MMNRTADHGLVENEHVDAREQLVLPEDVLQDPAGVMRAYLQNETADPVLQSSIQKRLNEVEPTADHFGILRQIAQSTLGIIPHRRSDDVRGIPKVPYTPNLATERTIAAAVIFELQHYQAYPSWHEHVHGLAFASQEWKGVAGQCIRHYLRRMPLDALADKVLQAERIQFSHIAHVVALACESPDAECFRELYAMFDVLIDRKIDDQKLGVSHFFFLVHAVPLAAMEHILGHLATERPRYCEELILYMDELRRIEAEMPSDDTEFQMWKALRAKTPIDLAMFVDQRYMGKAASDCLGPIPRKEDSDTAWVERITSIVRASVRSDIRHVVLKRIAETCTDDVHIEEDPGSATALEKQKDPGGNSSMHIILGTQNSLKDLQAVATDLCACEGKHLQEEPVDALEHIHVLRSLAVYLLSIDNSFAEVCTLLLQRADELSGREAIRPDWHTAALEEKIEMLKRMNVLGTMNKVARKDIIPYMTRRITARLLDEKRNRRLDGQMWRQALQEIYRLQNTDARAEFAGDLETLLLGPERPLVAALVLQGWRHLAGASEVSDQNWWGKVEASKANELQKLQKGSEQGQSAEYARIEAELINAVVSSTHASTESQPLRDAIRCKEYRRELQKLRIQGSALATAAKEREIVARVVGAVASYALPTDPEWQTNSYSGAFPRVIREKQTGSCFGGPWLVASLLLECGIPYERLSYCDVHRTANGTIGSHGSLLMGTEMKELLLIDTGYNITSTTMRLGWCNPATQEKMKGLLAQKSSEAVKVTWKDTMAAETGMHSDMYCMPLKEGVASIYLYNLGIALLHEKKMAEARYAFSLSLSFNSKNPDVLYYRGLCSFHEGDLDTAKTYCEQAVKQFDRHLLSHFSLGEIALRQGNYFEARKRFATVANCKDPVWGDQTFRVLAQLYSRYSPLELAVVWQEIARKSVENS